MQSIDSRRLAVKVLRNKDLQSILVVAADHPREDATTDNWLLATDDWQLTTDNCFSIDTNGQERRARRILPYKQSMVLLGNAVKLRK